MGRGGGFGIHSHNLFINDTWLGVFKKHPNEDISKYIEVLGTFSAIFHPEVFFIKTKNINDGKKLYDRYYKYLVC